MWAGVMRTMKGKLDDSANNALQTPKFLDQLTLRSIPPVIVAILSFVAEL